jgi:hypothetical protein
VIGTPLNFGGMTGRALAVICKLNFWKSCDQKKRVFWPLNRKLYGAPYMRMPLPCCSGSFSNCMHAAAVALLQWQNTKLPARVGALLQWQVLKTLKYFPSYSHHDNRYYVDTCSWLKFSQKNIYTILVLLEFLLYVFFSIRTACAFLGFDDTSGQFDIFIWHPPTIKYGCSLCIVEVT